MIENLVNLDKKIFLVLNHFAASGADPVMLFLSGPVPWILFFAGSFFIIRKQNRGSSLLKFFLMIFLMALVYLSTDQASVHAFKEVFMRLRPCHEPTLAGQVRLVADSCGGQFGFVSSHAANSFGLAIFSALLLRRKWLTISVLTWAILVSYSRIYVGVHYPGDALGGAVLGLFIASVVYLAASKWIFPKLPE